MKRFLGTITPLITIFVFLTISCFAENNAPEITYSVNMPPKMEKALHEFDPDFEIWSQTDFIPLIRNQVFDFNLKQTPSAVIGDFNGDGIKDIALFGHNQTDSRIISIVSDGNAFKAYEIASFKQMDPEDQWIVVGPDTKEHGLQIYITYHPPGFIESPYEEKGLDLKTDAIEIIYFEKAATLVYFEKGAFHEYVTAD